MTVTQEQLDQLIAVANAVVAAAKGLELADKALDEAEDALADAQAYRDGKAVEYDNALTAVYGAREELNAAVAAITGGSA